jgi:hypothetical protein
MKHMQKRKLFAFLAFATVLQQARAGNFTSDFNSGVPSGVTLNGTSVIEPTGGVNNSGVFKLTKALNSQSGSLVIDDLDAGNPVYGFDLTAKVRLGGGTGTPADGFSINFDPSAGASTVTGEEGTSGGITFAFDLYDNGSETPPAPSIDVKVGGALVATHKMSIPDFDTGTNFVDLHIQVAADGAVSLAYKGAVLFTNLYFNGYSPLAAAPFVFGGRTGGANENQFFDNLNITTYTTPKVGFSLQPRSQTVLTGHDAIFNTTANNTDGATFQWFKNGTKIDGATDLTLTVPSVTAANSGDKYKIVATGPNNTITSDEVTLTTVDITVPANPQISFNFDDGAVPAGTLLSPQDPSLGGYITTTGGTADSGVLHLTDAANGQGGQFFIDDFNAGAPVYGFTARFDALVGGGSVPPADGFSFSFGNDIADDATAGEDGVGSGLVVGFDIYDNGNENPPAPSIDVRYNGVLIGSVHKTFQQLETGTSFGEVLIQLNTDATISVAYKGEVIFNHLPIPAFGSIAGGRFALTGRTGGLNENQWIDNLEISTILTPGPIRITSAPAAQTILAGKTATFNVSVNDTNGVTYQFFKNGTAVGGTSSNSFTTAVTTAADNGAKYKVAVTKGGVTVTSDEVTLSVVDLTVPATPTVTFNFDDGALPAGTVGVDNQADTDVGGYVTTTGGVNDSGVLHVVDAVNGAQGAFIVQPLLGGAEVSTFTFAFDLRMGGGTTPPADGFSLNYAPDVPNTTVGVDGAGSGLSVVFDLWDNGNEVPPAPSIDLRYKGAVVKSIQLPYQQLDTGDAFRKVILRVGLTGIVDLSFGDRVVFNGVQLPNYTFIANGKLSFAGLTGGANENVWVDNISLALTKSTVLKFTTEPADLQIVAGQPATIAATVSDPAGITYQVLKNGTAIPGVATNTYVTPALTAADNNTTYAIKATGPGGTITTRTAVVTVIPAITISNPAVSFNFDDGLVPDGTAIYGTSAIGAEGALHLTDAINSQGGTIEVADFNNGEAVSAFTAHFKLLVDGGTAPPADGFSFVWANDFASGTIFGEDGTGSGLIISYDIYDNGNETPPAPSIDVKYNGTLVSTVHLTYQQMETGPNFADFNLRVEPDGTLDLQIGGKVVFNNVQLPGYTPLTNGVFAIGARTGGLNINQWIDDLQIATTTTVIGPTIDSITLQNGKIVVQWTGTATLEAAPAVTGPWNTVVGAASPYQTTPSQTMQFFRLKQ